MGIPSSLCYVYNITWVANDVIVLNGSGNVIVDFLEYPSIWISVMGFFRSHITSYTVQYVLYILYRRLFSLWGWNGKTEQYTLYGLKYLYVYIWYMHNDVVMETLKVSMFFGMYQWTDFITKRPHWPYDDTSNGNISLTCHR